MTICFITSNDTTLLLLNYYPIALLLLKYDLFLPCNYLDITLHYLVVSNIVFTQL